ncbi:GRAM domain-containing protein 3-like isoform X1 [Notothenia coriiceps]|uniref:GRAM domain-containing protein 3-like isoform X1 n=1 Tax=Notothenia coriiceps TaxID=8208 RepID=A0A6I9PSW3_9TELE|nr:PREDICTED: GRAM domain-containing protein 3-like isoform X1 [Notothenia coriiceps]
MCLNLCKCASWKYLSCTMSLKDRRFSLDSSANLDRLGLLGGRRGSNRFSSKKSSHSYTRYDAPLDIQELKHSINSNMYIRDPITEEDNIDRTDGFISNISFLKHNKTFHKIFPDIPEKENLTHTFSCALQKEVLYHGKLYVSENYVCFYSSVLLKETKVVIPASSVCRVKKHNSGLSMLSIQTADGDKCTFVSLWNREMCYQLLQTVCSQEQDKNLNGSPHVSSADNEADHDVASGYSSLEDSIDLDRGSEDSIYLNNDLPHMSGEGSTKGNSTSQNSTEGDGTAAVQWIWRIAESVVPLFFLREIRDLSALFYVFVLLIMLLLLASGYMGLKIIALEEQLTQLSFQHREYQLT